MLSGTGGHYFAFVKEERSCAASMAPIGPDRELKPPKNGHSPNAVGMSVSCPHADIAGSIRLPRRRGRGSSAEPVFWRANACRGGLASPDLRQTKLRFAERIMRLRLGPRPSRRIAYAMLLGEGLAARSAGFGLDRVN